MLSLCESMPDKSYYCLATLAYQKRAVSRNTKDNKGRLEEDSMEIVLTKPTAKDYVDLRIRSGMGEKDLSRSQRALDKSLFTASIYQDDLLIAFGRVVGDEGITFVVSDIMVDRAYWRQGYGDHIMSAIDDYLEEFTYEDSFVTLIARTPADKIYLKYNFVYVDETRHGMQRKQKKK